MPSLEIVGFAIVSADGMLADSSGVMPATLKFEADQGFFDAGLDRADLIVHGRNSYEDQTNSPRRKRLIATRRVDAPISDPSNPNATLWNPAHASFDQACAFAGVRDGQAAVIGGTDIFDMFLDRYAIFWLSQAPHLTLPGGIPVFHRVPAQSPQAILSAHGLRTGETRILDPDHDVSVVEWRRGG